MGKNELVLEVANLRERIEKEKSALQDEYFEGGAKAPAVGHSIEKRRTLQGHFGKVYSIHWAGGDGEQICSASQDGKLLVWNADSTNKQQAILLRYAWVMTCAFEQTENNFVACGGLDNVCSIFKINQTDAPANIRAHKELSGHDGYLSCCRFVGSNRLVTSSGDSTCKYWDVEGNKCITTFTDHKGDVMSVSPSPTDPNVFVSGSCDMECKVWDIRTGGKAAGSTTIKYAQGTYSGHESDVNALMFYPDGQAFGTGSDDSSCRLFDMRCLQQVNLFRSSNVVCGITSIDFSSSGRLLFGGYENCQCIGWDVAKYSGEGDDGKKVVNLEDHNHRVSCVAVHKKGTALATGSWDTFIRIYA